MGDLVECRSEYDYAGRPTAVWWQGVRLEVAAVEAQWRTPDGKGFRVRTTDGQVFEVFYGAMNDEWTIRQP